MGEPFLCRDQKTGYCVDLVVEIDKCKIANTYTCRPLKLINECRGQIHYLCVINDILKCRFVSDNSCADLNDSYC